MFYLIVIKISLLHFNSNVIKQVKYEIAKHPLKVDHLKTVWNM
jgi:hypothetical protein